jgi:preprotein translocase subunit YajC
MIKFMLTFVAAGVVTTPALAQGLAAGAPIVDTQGRPVGTVTAVSGDAATVRTDRHEVRLPLASIRVEKTGGVVGMTQAELNADVERAMAQMASALAPGATVFDPAGGVAGTIVAVADDLVTLKLPGEQEVRLPKSAFSQGRRGLLIGTTAAQLAAQVSSGS